MQHREFIGQSDDEIVLEMCRDELSTQEMRKRMETLIVRNKESLERGLKKLFNGGGLWDKALSRMGIESPESLLEEVRDHFLHTPQGGNYPGVRRVCQYLKSDKPFDKWMYRKLFAVVRKIQKKVPKKIEEIKKEKYSKPDEPVLSRSPISFTAVEAVASDESELDQIYRHVDQQVRSFRYVSKILVGQLDNDCESVLRYITGEDSLLNSNKPLQEAIEDAIDSSMKCLKELHDIMKKEGVEPKYFGVEYGLSDLWNCIVQLDDQCRFLILGYHFLDINYWRLGEVYSDKDMDDFDDFDEYKRKEYEWARYRIKKKCKKGKAEEMCSEGALNAI